MAETKKSTFADKLNALMNRYGAVAITVYFSIFGLVLVGFYIAIKQGVEVKSAAGSATTWGAAWLATKVTQPLRILATLVLTPAIAAVLEKTGLRKPPASSGG